MAGVLDSICNKLRHTTSDDVESGQTNHNGVCSVIPEIHTGSTTPENNNNIVKATMLSAQVETRKNRRKSRTPRSICQIKSFVDEEEDRETDVSHDLDDYIEELEADYDDYEARGVRGSSSERGMECNKEWCDKEMSSDENPIKDRGDDHSDDHREDEDIVRDYAESAMDELLSIYGHRNSDDSSSVIDSIPQKYFAAGKILQMSAYPQPKASPPISKNATDTSPEILTSSNTFPFTKPSQSFKHNQELDALYPAPVTTTDEDRIPSPTDSPSSNEGFYAKFLDNVRRSNGEYDGSEAEI